MVIQKNGTNSNVVASLFLKKGEIVILPTDTVYGFSGIVPDSKQRIFEIKRRENTKELISLISEPSDIFKYTDTPIPDFLFKLWPAPLTLIVKEKKSAESLAFRCPDDEWLRSVIKKTGQPIYSTSVNYSGFPVLTEIEAIKREFEDKTALIVDGGILCGASSTIISLLEEKPIIIRTGKLDISV